MMIMRRRRMEKDGDNVIFSYFVNLDCGKTW
jgi:hypothetical protein